jgi:hypothetical protein
MRRSKLQGNVPETYGGDALASQCGGWATGVDLGSSWKAAMRRQANKWAAMLAIALGALLGILIALRWMR